jgi:hypothetical protein
LIRHPQKRVLAQTAFFFNSQRQRVDEIKELRHPFVAKLEFSTETFPKHGAAMDWLCQKRRNEKKLFAPRLTVPFMGENE